MSLSSAGLKDAGCWSLPEDPEELVDLRVAMEQRLLGGKFSKDGAGAPNVNRGGVTRRTQEDLWSSVPQGHHLEHTEFSQSAPGGPAESVGQR